MRDLAQAPAVARQEKRRDRALVAVAAPYRRHCGREKYDGKVLKRVLLHHRGTLYQSSSPLYFVLNGSKMAGTQERAQQIQSIPQC